MCFSINPFVYLKSQYYFTFLACFFCFHFFTFCFGTANTQNILFKDKYFALLYWTSQLYLSTNFINLYVKYYISSFNVLHFMYFLHLLLLQHGDIERNPGPQSGHIKNLSCCHWNVNNLVAQNLSKITQLEACNSLHKHDLYAYLKHTLIHQF